MEVAILVGLQASGKSTFFRERFARTHEHVSKDLLRNNRRRDRRQRDLVEIALRAGRSVVVDNTNPTPQDRRPLVELGHEHGARVVGYFFEAGTRACVGRNRGREGKARVPEVAIFTTAKKLMPPAFSEGFDDLFRVRLTQNHGFRVEPERPADAPSR